MDDVIRFLKQNKHHFIKYGKKAFTWWKKNQGKNNGQNQSYAAGAGAGYAGAAAYGASNSWNDNSQQQQHQQQQHYQLPPQGQYPSPPAWNHGAATQGPHYKYSADNQVNQHDAHYLELRNRARSEGDAMAKAFDQAHNAHNAGDGAAARQLSSQGHQHKVQMERLNKEAADWIFMANNEDSPVGTVDLHGLYTSEALERTEEAVREGQSKGWPELRIIVGKGIHSKDHRAKIAPAVEKLMREYRLDAHLDPHNTGVLVVKLQGSGAGNASFTRDLAKQVSGKEDECVIM